MLAILHTTMQNTCIQILLSISYSYILPLSSIFVSGCETNIVDLLLFSKMKKTLLNKSSTCLF